MPRSGNALLIDGVDTRDPSGGTAWTFYNFNIVEEVQAVGIGAPAEFGSFSGAVINTLTKSGGNRYSGLFDVTFTNSDLAGDNIDQTTKTLNPALGDPAVTNKQLDFTTQLGGPLIKDKLFFFASAQRYHLNQDPTGPRSVLDEVSPRFNGKLTWQPSPNDILTGTVQFDSYSQYGRADLPAALTTDELTNQEDAPEWVWLTSWRHLFGSRTFTEIKYTGWWGYYDLSPKTRAPQHYDGETGLYSVSQGWAYAADRGRHQVNASISHFAETWGRHDLKFGVEVERSRTRDRNYYINGKYYYDYGGQPYLAYTGSNYDVAGRNRRESVFVQDAWKPNDRLTLNLGVRLDHLSGGEPDKDAVYTNTVVRAAARVRSRPDRAEHDRAEGQLQPVLRGDLPGAVLGCHERLCRQRGLGHERLSGVSSVGPDDGLLVPGFRRRSRSAGSRSRSHTSIPTSSTRGSTSGAWASSTSSAPTGARRRPGSTARTRTSWAGCCPMPAGSRSRSTPRPARRSAPTARAAAPGREGRFRPTAGPTAPPRPKTC